MHRRGRADARLGDLGGDVDLEPELAAQPAGGERLTEAAELDQLERDTLAVRAPGCLDVAERMDALVETDRHARARQRLDTGKIIGRKRLLDEQKLCLARAFDIAARSCEREPAI